LKQSNRLNNLKQLFSVRKPIFSAKKRRVQRSHTIYDLRLAAKKATPRGPFDYTDGAAEQEISLNRARKSFEDIEFLPHILRDVSNVSLETQMLGKTYKMPVGIAPTGFTRMMHTDGEKAGASTAATFGIPFTLSTMGTTSIEKVKESAPNGSNWFQLYLWRDRERSLELIKRAETAGYDGLVLTVDAQVAGARLRDVRNGLTVPPTLTVGTFLNALPRPGWWWNFLTKEPLNFAALESWNGTVAQLMDTMFDPSMTYEDLKWIRSIWKKKLIVKGVQRLDDALKCADYGVDAVVLSNHGGRQLDRAPVPFELLPIVRRELKSSMEIHIDTGIMHGADIVAAKALGADFTWIGRAYLYGLMAGGKIGVERTLTILQTQMVRTLKLLGANSFAEIDASMIKFLK
jgi:isopentenyl diphosphate isomerase/L-lactate dehydrogenase-like FMN-dependent dehydrogenase